MAHKVRAVTRGRYVVVKGRFGMGGRIAVMMSALRYARATARELIVDWNDFAYYSPAVGDVFSALFERPVTSLRPLSELRGLSVHPEAWSGLLEAYRDDLNAEIMPYELSFCPPPEDDSDIDADVVVVTRNTANRRIRASYQELCPRRIVTDFASDFKRRLFRESMIGVHVRHGNGERCFRPPNLSWFREQVAELRAAAPEHGLLLCTDGRGGARGVPGDLSGPREHLQVVSRPRRRTPAPEPWLSGPISQRGRGVDRHLAVEGLRQLGPQPRFLRQDGQVSGRTGRSVGAHVSPPNSSDTRGQGGLGQPDLRCRSPAGLRKAGERR